MKKVVLSFMILSAVLSCKKDEKADLLPEHTEEIVSHQVISEPMTTASFAKEEHDFGNLKKGDVVQYAYEVTNTSRDFKGTACVWMYSSELYTRAHCSRGKRTDYPKF